jgi:hypothetical protein
VQQHARPHAVSAANAPTQRSQAQRPSGGQPGNQARLRDLSAKSMPVPGGLRIGAVDDPLEREADAAAEQVTRMPDPSPVLRSSPPQISRKCAACDEQDSKKPE